MKTLRAHFGDDWFTAEAVLNVEADVLNGLICKVGFHNKKTIYMQQTAAMLIEKYGGDIPDTIEGMLELPGIGPKMGYLALQIAFDKVCEIIFIPLQGLRHRC